MLEEKKKKESFLLENDSMQKTNPYSSSNEFWAETWALTARESPEQEFPIRAGSGLHLLGGYFQFWERNAFLTNVPRTWAIPIHLAHIPFFCLLGPFFSSLRLGMAFCWEGGMRSTAAIFMKSVCTPNVYLTQSCKRQEWAVSALNGIVRGQGRWLRT